MDYGRQSDTSTLKGPDSVKSWGSAFPPPAAQSHVSSWGTVHTNTSHGHGSQSSQATWGPPPASSWGSQSTLVSPNPEAWKCLSPVSSPYAPSLSSATVVEVQSHGVFMFPTVHRLRRPSQPFVVPGPGLLLTSSNVL
ncbi:hypothetical protein B0H34DRAFT_791867 [Crassisporium funariophilum]|nr:hypothetical protein B0H34DRAFT_791867 [Crassisporium funariophilum]